MSETRPAVAGAVKLRAPNPESAAAREDAGDGLVWVPAAEAAALMASHGFRSPDAPEPALAAASAAPPPDAGHASRLAAAEAAIEKLAALVAEHGPAIEALAKAVAALGQKGK